LVNGAETCPDSWKVDGVAEVVEPLGSDTNLHMDLQGIKVVAKCDGRRIVEAGDRFKMALNLEHLHIFDGESTLSIY
jgi:multiple sugar transport system ATP-binding protein